MLEQMRQTIEQQRLLPKGSLVTVGVSGGPDSIALLHALNRLRSEYHWQLSAVHVNHGLRGEESDADARYVSERCEAWGIPCRVERVDVKGELAKGGANRQAVARKLRYEAFRRAVASFGADRLALAHQADDQVETVLMRLLRGTGPSGLTGIPLAREWEGIHLVRPLLEVRRSEVEAYCAEHGLRPRQDPSNRDPRYMRNRIRLELVPQLETYNPRFQKAILQLSRIAAEEERYWEELAKQESDKVVEAREEGKVALHIPSLLEADVALQRRVIKLILNCLAQRNEQEVTLDSVEKVRKLAGGSNPSALVPLPGELWAEREYSRLWIMTSPPTVPSEETAFNPVVLSVPGEHSFPEGTIQSWIGDRAAFQPSPSRALFDLDRLQTPLIARPRAPGDRIRPLGLGGSKKVKDVLIDAKISRRRREGLPLVVAGEEVIWIPGVTRSDQAMVTGQTRRYLHLEWLWDGNVPGCG